MTTWLILPQPGLKIRATGIPCQVVVLQTGDEYKLLARNPLGEEGQSTPAVANGTMFLRSATHLKSIGGKQEVKQTNN